MPIVDLHCDTVMRIQSGADITKTDGGHVDIPRLKAGGVGLQGFAAFIAPDVPATDALAETIEKLDVITALCEANPDDLQLVKTATDVIEAVRGERVGVLLTVENGHAIECSLDNLQRLRDRGVRSMTLVHSKNLSWVASCSEESCPFDGLTSFGNQVVDAMNEMGMIVDVSHASEAAFWKIAARVRRSGKPFIASHSNAWELCRMSRNLKDDQIREIAEQGGTIGVNFFPWFLDQAYYDNALRLKDEGLTEDNLIEKMSGVSVTSEAILDHIDYIVALVGDRHVSLGSDFDGIPSTPDDVTGSDGYPVILDRLAERGYSDESIERIAWGNFMRVFAAHD